MKRILIAIDYNPNAERVAEMGYAVAKAMQAEVSIIHVITEPAFYALDYSPIMGYQGSYTNDNIALVEDIKKQAADFLDASVKHLGDANIKTRVLEGETAETILSYCKEWEADLIVMGSHSHRGLDRLLVSDIAADILKHSKIPLLAIPTED